MGTRRLEDRVVVCRALALVAAIIPFLVLAVKAEPLGPATFTVTSSSRAPTNPASTVEALAGNVTELVINATVVTRAWAGYYGNVSGTIVLDDALNNSLYSWSIDQLVGEVYASRKAADFSSSNIICPNSSVIAAEETNLSIAQTDKDGVNETFSYMTHPSFYVGNKLFSADACNYTVSTYVNDALDSARRFNETLLYDIANIQVIYVALLTTNQDGFKIGSDQYDFQMLVGEDGHSNSDTTTYYFYVELE